VTAGTDLDSIASACLLALDGDASRVVSFDAEVVLEIVRRLRGLDEGCNASAVKSFVATRLESMASRPRSWAATKETFIVQLALLVEVSRIGLPKDTGKPDALMSDLCGAEAGCAVPSNLLTVEWARGRVDIARKRASL
jgi:hypothetical protein